MAKFRAFSWWLHRLGTPFKSLNYKGAVRNIRLGLSDLCDGLAQILAGVLEFAALPLCPVWLPLLALYLGYRAIKQKIVFAKGTEEKRAEWKKRPIGKYIELDGGNGLPDVPQSIKDIPMPAVKCPKDDSGVPSPRHFVPKSTGFVDYS